MSKSGFFTFSFAVGSEYGPRSWAWTVTVDGSDTYVTSKALSSHIKVTLHESGRWHLKEVPKGGGPYVPVAPLLKSHAAASPRPFKMGFCLIVPDDCLRPARDVDRATKVDEWFERPAYGGFVEIFVGEWRHGRDSNEPPMHSEGFNLRYIATAVEPAPLRGIFVGYKAVPAEHEVGQRYTEMLREAMAVLPKPEMFGERRYVKLGIALTGEILALELSAD